MLKPNLLARAVIIGLAIWLVLWFIWPAMHYTIYQPMFWILVAVCALLGGALA